MRKHSWALVGVLIIWASVYIAIVSLDRRIVKLEQACHGQCIKNKDAACQDRCAKAHHCPEVDY